MLESPLLTLIEGLLGLVVSTIVVLFTIKVMSSDAADETFPAVSLNQTYTVREWFPADEAPESVKLTVAE